VVDGPPGDMGTNVTEAEWNICADPRQLLAVLRDHRWASDRKLRLFAVACFQQWPPSADKMNRRAGEVAERHADGQADDRQLSAALRQALGTTNLATNPTTDVVGMDAYRAAAWTAADVGLAIGESQRTIQAALVRCIFGPLLFRPVIIEPAWRTAIVLELARRSYEARDFSLLPALGAALSDAGCQDSEILAHCASEGPHCRGCWLIDCLLERE
jgi:hypothetical protein